MSGGAERLDVLAQIFARYRASMWGRIAALQDAAGAGLAGGLPAQLRRRAEEEAHKLAGSLGTFGMAEGSRLAREIEWLLRGAGPVEGAGAWRLSELVVALSHQLAVGPPGGPPADDSADADAGPDTAADAGPDTVADAGPDPAAG